MNNVVKENSLLNINNIVYFTYSNLFMPPKRLHGRPSCAQVYAVLRQNEDCGRNTR
jgi:hypothetical protein